MRAVLAIFAALLALACAQSTGFCMNSPGNGPTTIPSGATIWGGYSFTYPTVHEPATLNVNSGALTLVVACNGVQSTIQVPIGADAYSVPRVDEAPAVYEWYPTDSESGTAAFQGSASAPTCNSGLQVLSAKLCLSVTSDNNADTVWFRWHYAATTGSQVASFAWSDVKAITPAPDCGSAVEITNPECGVSCKCFGFEAVYLLTDTESGVTTISLKVTQVCETGLSYIAIGTAGLGVISPTDGSTYTGTSGQKYKVIYTGTTGNPGFTSIKYVPGDGSVFKNGFSETFTLEVTGYYPGYQFTLQGHIGGFYEQFGSVDLGGCLCPQEDPACQNVVPPPVCPPGSAALPDNSGCSTTDCAHYAPNGEVWICTPSGSASQPYYLTSIPESDPLPTGAFYLPSTTGSQDPQGYTIDCQCKRSTVPCPNSCCGLGTCDDRTGECTCTVEGASGDDCCTYNPGTTGAATTGATSAGTTTPPPRPCENGGKFCNGHGTCILDEGKCNCTFVGSEGQTYTGDYCDVLVAPPSCFDYTSDCQSCIAPPDSSLQCSWCSSTAGDQCLASGDCENPQLACGDGVVPYIPPECSSDLDCNGKGSCVNSTEGNYCQCDNGERGVDCASGGLSKLGKALAISGGIIALIVIGGVVALVLLGFGIKKGVDFVALREMNMAASSENPLYKGQSEEHISPIHS